MCQASPVFTSRGPAGCCRCAWLVLSAPYAATCGDTNGTDPFAGTVVYESADQSFHLRPARAALDPGDGPTGPDPVPGAVPTAISLSATPASASDALYTLQVTPRPANAATAFPGQRQRAVPALESQTKQTLVATGGRAASTSAGRNRRRSITARRTSTARAPTAASSCCSRAGAAGRRRHDPLEMIISFGPGLDHPTRAVH